MAVLMGVWSFMVFWFGGLGFVLVVRRGSSGLWWLGALIWMAVMVRFGECFVLVCCVGWRFGDFLASCGLCGIGVI